MAMYYCASKLHKATCRRCSGRVKKVPPAPSESLPLPPVTDLATLPNDPALMQGSGLSYNDQDAYFRMLRSTEIRGEPSCVQMNETVNFVNAPSISQQSQCPAVITPTVRTLSAHKSPKAADVEYSDGRIVSANMEGLVELMRPGVSQSFIFTFLLCCRLFIRPHEVLYKLCKKYARNIDRVTLGPEEARDRPDMEIMNMSMLMELLSEWMTMFPYDFRDDRVMALVRSITHRCSAEHMEDVRNHLTAILAKLLKKLKELVEYEATFKDVRVVTDVNELSASDIITLGLTPAELANQLMIVELHRMSYIGPEEFVRAFAPPPPNIPPPVKMTQPSKPSASDKPLKTTRNLQAYADWFNRLSYLVATDILKASKYRARLIEQWVMTARECFNLANFNSMMAIISALNMVPIARLKKTWARTSTICCQQLRQLELCIEPSSNHARYRTALEAAPTETVVPLLSVTCRDLHFANQASPSKLPGNRINFEKCAQLARLVCKQLAARRLCGDGPPVPSPAKPHPPAWRYLCETNVLQEKSLELLSFEREPPMDNMEKERLKRIQRGI